MIQDIFKTPIYVSSCNVNRNKLLEYVNQYVERNPTGKQASNAGGYQSFALNYDIEPIKSLLNEIIKNVYGYGKEIKIKSPIQLQGIWFNINKTKESNMRHIHSGILSGVYYLKTNKDCGPIRFYHGYNDLMGFTWGNAEWKEKNDRNSEHWDIVPNNNDLILFPSFLQHSVLANESTEDRISFSFNFGI